MKPELLALFGDKPLLMQADAVRVIAARLARAYAALGMDGEGFQRWMASRTERRPYDVDLDGAAVIPIKGMILKAVPPWLEYYGEYLGWDFCSTERTRAAVAAACEDDAVRSIRLEIDSPGGTVDGVQALADDVFAARSLKTLVGEVDGLMASAALWIGAQASKMSCGPLSEIGSLGVFTVIQDWSGYATELGVKVHVISNAPGKGYAFGATVPPEQLENAQALVDGITKEFVGAVARGREMEFDDVATLATGQVWLGLDAKKHGLVDKVGPDRRAIKGSTGQQASQEQEQSIMTKQEIEQMQAKNAALEAENTRLREDNEKATAGLEAQKALLEASDDAARVAILDKHAGRVPPSAREKVLKFGKITYGSDMAGFESYISGLPVITRAKAEGATPEGGPEGAKPGEVALTPEELKICQLRGRDPKVFLAHKQELIARGALPAHAG